MKKILILPIIFTLGGCAGSNPDLSLASLDFLCYNYQWNLQNPQSLVSSAEPYADEIRRRGKDCSEYKGKADVKIDVNQ